MPKTGAMVEFLLGGTWTDVTSRLYHRDRIRITRGRRDEGARVDPGSCSFTLNNKGGYFSPRNPMSPLYGLIGRNTPVRISTAVGAPWLDVPDGSANVATTPDAAVLDITGDIDIRAEVQTGTWADGVNTYEIAGKIAAAGQASWLLTIDQLGQVNLWWSPDGTNLRHVFSPAIPRPAGGRTAVRVTLDVNNGSGGHMGTFYTAPSMAGPWTQVGAPTSDPGVTTTQIFASTTPLQVGNVSSVGYQDVARRVYAVEVRNGINGPVVAAPDFTVQAIDATAFTDSAGRAWTVSAGAITNRLPRFVGEVSSWPTRWDVTGGDVYVPVQAAGIMRRLGQGSDPLRSTLARRVPSDPNIAAYWPMEETGGGQAYSPLAGVGPMRVTGMQWAGDDSLAGSLALPQVASPCSISASVPSWASPSQWRVELVYRLDTVPSSLGTLINFTSNGTVKRWTVRYGNGQVEVVGVAGDGTNVVDLLVTPLNNAALYGSWVRQQFLVSQSGGTVTWTLAWVGIGNSNFGTVSDTYTGTTGACTGVFSSFSTQTIGTAIGHVGVFKVANTQIYDNADTGFTGETAAARLARLTGEEGVPYVTPYGTVDTSIMGPQTADTLLDLLAAAQSVDLGILYEARDSIALAYRPRTSLYNQSVTLPIDYQQKGLTTPLDPVDDDQATVNDVTVSRPNGSSARATLDTGPLSTQAPPAGVGRYPSSTTVACHDDDQLSDLAGWLLHLGTWDAQRYPSVTLNLAAASPALIQAATAVDVGDRAQITNPPPWLPPETIDLIVEGYTEVLGWADWSITYNCTPAGPWTVAILGDPVLGKADTAGAQLAAGVTATATTLSIATTVGPLWTVDPAEFPFDLRLGGEIVTATACSGTTSPQAMTVVRAVNGVSRAWTAGTDIRLAHPMIVTM